MSHEPFNTLNNRFLAINEKALYVILRAIGMSLIGDFEYFLKLKNNQYTANNYLHVLNSRTKQKKNYLNPSDPDSN